MINKPVVLVTGASRGIGRAITRKFADEGLSVALTARNPEKLQETADLITRQGGEDPLIIPADLTDEQQISKLVDRVIEQWGRIDVLVNNAGIGYLKPFTELTVVEFKEMMAVNMTAVFSLTQKVVPYMMKRKNGVIINIASLAGKNGFKLGTGYAASKWALRGFAQCLMLEVRDYDIRVVTIFPGSVDTEFNRGGLSPTATPPANKMMPEDIAEVAVMAYRMPARTMVSEIDMRPTNPKKNS
ncbi:MAG: SDR family oxidoreductase [Calditrichia bacterium]